MRSWGSELLACLQQAGSDNKGQKKWALAPEEVLLSFHFRFIG
jgi:hypothetical protein